MYSNSTSITAKAGSLLLVDSGSYSDYSVIGFFVTLRDFCPQDELNEYLMQEPSDYFDGDKFLAFLLAKGLLLEIEHGNLYLGEYSSAEDFRFTPRITPRI